MKVHYVKSSTIIIEANEVKILTDPWLTDGEYYGAWYHYPPLEFKEHFFENIDYIYISHIHPDHFSKATLQKLNINIPIIIHCFESKFFVLGPWFLNLEEFLFDEFVPDPVSAGHWDFKESLDLCRRKSWVISPMLFGSVGRGQAWSGGSHWITP